VNPLFELRQPVAASTMMDKALIRGEFELDEIGRMTGLPERSARRVLNDVIELIRSETQSGPLTIGLSALTGVGCAACPRSVVTEVRGDPDLSAVDRLRV
jgi:hypothetical protein